MFYSVIVYYGGDVQVFEFIGNLEQEGEAIMIYSEELMRTFSSMRRLRTVE